jgi:hypothetical protein
VSVEPGRGTASLYPTIKSLQDWFLSGKFNVPCVLCTHAVCGLESLVHARPSPYRGEKIRPDKSLSLELEIPSVSDSSEMAKEIGTSTTTGPVVRRSAGRGAHRDVFAGGAGARAPPHPCPATLTQAAVVPRSFSTHEADKGPRLASVAGGTQPGPVTPR